MNLKSWFPKLVVPRIKPETSISSVHTANLWATEILKDTFIFTNIEEEEGTRIQLQLYTSTFGFLLSQI